MKVSEIGEVGVEVGGGGVNIYASGTATIFLFLASFFLFPFSEDVTVLELMYRLLTRMSGDTYRKRFRSVA